MKCFYHHDADAIGLCKACSKGLCVACAVDVGMGLACRETCVEQVRRLIELVERNIRLTPVSEQMVGGHWRSYLAAGVFALVAGVVFVMMGLSLDDVGRTGVVAIGCLAMIGGVVQLGRGWRLRRTTRAMDIIGEGRRTSG